MLNVFTFLVFFTHCVCVVSLHCSLKVLERNDLPTLDAWSGNPLPLCPLMVDNKLRIESSGGQTLQVCFSSSAPGGEVLQAGCSMEEVRFCVSPEGLLVKLVMDSLEPNEVIIVTVSECCVMISTNASSSCNLAPSGILTVAFHLSMCWYFFLLVSAGHREICQLLWITQ